MTLFSQDHYELIANFEREFKGLRFDKETKNLWPKGNIYQSGDTNNIFLAYRRGYALGRSTERLT